MNKYTIDSIMQDEDVAVLLPQGDEANAIIISLKQLPTYIQEGDVISAKVELGLAEKAYMARKAFTHNILPVPEETTQPSTPVAYLGQKVRIERDAIGISNIFDHQCR
ncbi:MAG: hypothetical protein KGZ63_11270 [Clostridiales bacterium]|jgi:hypothetical protein|nr:hypothetical protein [Clostridiales bacterium]